ncbi:MAG TPA: hypothetical protein DCG19_03450 [Cryomorphaceae bacterium]|nr:hypothetical protein [Owenweeksia sp.]MBF99667.1 hypothetical protein [Owenweeksia sp.]HAD96434.1 hypothetical protein [Cryomorphaceae bacterium]HBF18679.1 hypothetical protein [Cryomorphaceae bacterium]|tara:strand:- start:77 stop:1945 length:1869 start_codon:yes stop_codon:yes gene_type:complete
MKAVILAGGKGTRLGKLTQDIPKPMIPVAGKPLLEYQVELCRRYHIEEVILLVNHLSESIYNYFKDGRKFGISISYYEEQQPLGTVGGVKELEDRLDSDFLVLYGDVMMEMDLRRLIDFHHTNTSEATLVVHPNDHPYDSDLVELADNDRIKGIYPKPHPEGFRYHNMVNAAAYIFSPVIFKHLEKGVKADFGKDIFPKMVGKLRMFGYNTPEYLKDMGTPDRLGQVEYDLKSGKVARRSLEQKQKAIFLDRDGVLNYDTDLIHRPEDFNLYPFTAKAVKKINASDYISVVTTNQSVVARNLTTIEGLGEIHKKMETLLGSEGAKLDAIYYCPHHPDKGYPGENPDYKIDCECRKPKAGMHKKAAEKFNIDLESSFMIGDSERDVMAGRNAGCTTVGVRTGHGLKGSKALPDYLFENLNEAVDFILDEPYGQVLKSIKEKIAGSDSQPYIISIGGVSRSGKSTLATYLKKGLEQDGKTVERINLDNWILPREKREREGDVLHNFQSVVLEKDLADFFKGKEITSPGYHQHPSWPVKSSNHALPKTGVVIIEGVIALSLAVLEKHSNLRIFKKVGEADLKQRFKTFYQWKEYSEKEIEDLWNVRKPREHDQIAKDADQADMVI